MCDTVKRVLIVYFTEDVARAWNADEIEELGKFLQDKYGSVISVEHVNIVEEYN